MSGFLPPLVLELRAKAGEVKSELAETRKEIKKTGDEAEKSSGRMSRAFHGAAAMGKVLAVGAIGLGVAIGGFAVEAATAADNANSNLSAALKNAHTSFEALKGPIEDTDAGMRKLGYTNADTNQTLAQMTVALGDPKKAMSDLGLAADIARLKHIGLAQAGILVAKAAEGQTRPLKALGIDLPIVAGGAKAVATAQNQLSTATVKAKTFLNAHGDAVKKTSKYHLTYMQMLDKVHLAQRNLTASQQASQGVLDALRKRVGGTATEFGSTLSGKIAAAHAQLESMGETLGNKLIPIITKVIGVATAWAQSLMANKPALIAIGAVIGTVLVTAIGAYITSLVIATATSIASFGAMIAKVVMWAAVQMGATGATEGVTAAQWLLNAALSANPIGLVVLAIVALVAVFVVAYNKVGWFHTAVQAAFKGIKVAIGWIGTAVSAVIGFVRSHWQTILAILTGPIGLAVKFVHDKWSAITGIFTTVKAAIGTALGDLGAILIAPFKFAFNMVATIWDDTIGKIGFSLPGWLGGGSWHMPQIPHFAAGGTMARAGLAVVGEHGREIVALPGGARVYRSGTGPAMAAGGGSGGVHLHVNFYGPMMADRRQAAAFAREIDPHLQTLWLQYSRRNAFTPLGHVT